MLKKELSKGHREKDTVGGKVSLYPCLGECIQLKVTVEGEYLEVSH